MKGFVIQNGIAEVNIPAMAEILEAEFAFDAKIRPLVERVVNASQGWPRFSAVREFYRAVTPRILAAEPYEWAIDPYTLCIQGLCTPIEFAIWCDIRVTGAVMYPQYPVGRYFLDFANPAARVAIECDGREYHQDKAKDYRRDRELARMGWSVYRIEGWQCVAPDTVLDVEGNDVPNPKRAAVIVREIAARHGLSRRYVEVGDEID